MEKQEYVVRPDVLNYDDIRKMAPFLDGKEKLVKWLMHLLQLDEVNRVHSRWCDTPGPEFVKRMVEQDFKIRLRVDNEQVLDHLPKGAFITVSNHPFGALDGILLVYLIAQRRPEFRVMVNEVLNRISAMQPNFIAVNVFSGQDPEKRKVSQHGIRQVLQQLRDGEPVGFFPAGAMSKVDWKLRLHDRPWQDSVLRIIKKAEVPVIPVFFQGSNSWWFNFLGVVCWQARTLRLPAEIFRRRNQEMRISIGNPISVEEQRKYATPEELGRFLRQQTYALRQPR